MGKNAPTIVGKSMVLASNEPPVRDTTTTFKQNILDIFEYNPIFVNFKEKKPSYGYIDDYLQDIIYRNIHELRLRDVFEELLFIESGNSIPVMRKYVLFRNIMANLVYTLTHDEMDRLVDDRIFLLSRASFREMSNIRDDTYNRILDPSLARYHICKHNGYLIFLLEKKRVILNSNIKVITIYDVRLSRNFLVCIELNPGPQVPLTIEDLPLRAQIMIGRNNHELRNRDVMIELLNEVEVRRIRMIERNLMELNNSRPWLHRFVPIRPPVVMGIEPTVSEVEFHRRIVLETLTSYVDRPMLQIGRFCALELIALLSDIPGMPSFSEFLDINGTIRGMDVITGLIVAVVESPYVIVTSVWILSAPTLSNMALRLALGFLSHICRFTFVFNVQDMLVHLSRYMGIFTAQNAGRISIMLHRFRSYITDFITNIYITIRFYSDRLRSDFLVGIETNPGPVLSKFSVDNSKSFNRVVKQKEIRFTKEQEKDFLAEARKHKVHPSKTKLLSKIDPILANRLIKQIKKLKQQEISGQRDNKFIPQMFSSLKPSVNLDLGEETSDLVKQLLDAVNNLRDTGIKIDGSVNFPQVDSTILKIKESALAFVGGDDLKLKMIILLLVSSFNVWHYLYPSDSILTKSLLLLVNALVVITYDDWMTKAIAGIGVSIALLAKSNNYTEIYTTDSIHIDKNVIDIFSPQMETPIDVSKPSKMFQNAVFSVMGAIYTLIFGLSWQQGNFLNFLKYFSQVKHMKEGLEDFMVYLSELVSFFLNWLGGKIHVPKMFSPHPFPEIEEISNKLERYTKMFQEGAPFNYSNAQMIFDLASQVRTAYSKIPNGRDYDKYRVALNHIDKLLKPFLDRFASANITGNGFKMEAIGILIGGGTGVGKSTLCVTFFDRLMARCIPARMIKDFMANSKDFIYSLQSERDFWDAYHGQFITLIDELGAYKDSKSIPDQACINVLRMINVAPQPLNAASLAEKGNLNFSSEFVVCTTNRSCFIWEALVCSKAFVRRFRIQVIAAPKIEFCHDWCDAETTWEKLYARELDPQKIAAYTDKKGDFGTDYTLDFYEFYDWNFLEQDHTGTAPWRNEPIKTPPRDYYAFEDYVVNLYKVHKKKSESMFEWQTAHKMSSLLKYRQADLMELQVSMDDMKKKAEVVKEDDIFRFEPDGDPISPVLYNDIMFMNLNNKRDWFVKLKTYIIEQNKADWYFLLSTTQERLDFLWEFVRRDMEVPAQTVNQSIPYLREILFALGCVGVVSSALVLYNILSPVVKSMVCQSSVVKVGRSNGKIPRFNRTAFKPQMGININSQDRVNSIHRRNSYSLDVYLADKGEIVTESLAHGKITFFKGRCAFMPAHYWHLMYNLKEDNPGEDVIMIISRSLAPDSSFSVNFDACKFVSPHADTPSMFKVGSEIMKIPEDIVFAKFPGYVNPHKDITKDICSSKRILPETTKGGIMLWDKNIKKPAVFYSFPFWQISSDVLEGYGKTQMVMYDIETTSSSCGSLGYFLNPVDGLFQIGLIHNAGRDRGIRAAGVPVTRESCELAYDWLMTGCEDLITDVEHFECQMYSDINCGSQYTTLGKIETVNVPTKTNLIKTELYEDLKPIYNMTKVPALLHNKGDLKPMVLARSKYGGNKCFLDPKLLDYVTRSYAARLFSVSYNNTLGEARLLTLDEALHGIPGVYRAISKTTALGYLWNIKIKGSGKKGIFGEEPGFDLSSEEAIEVLGLIQIILDKMKKGIKVEIPFMCWLKDELRPLEKVMSGSTRMFMASSFVLLVISRVYLGHFSIWISENRIANMTALGINPYSSEWNILGNYLQSVGDNGIAGDFSSYDGSQLCQVTEQVRLIAELFYHNSSLEDRRVRAIIWNLCSCPILIMPIFPSDIPDITHLITIVIQVYNINSSGNPNTPILNSLANILKLLYVISRLSEANLGYVDLDETFTNVRIMVFGDDNLVFVSSKYMFVTQEALTLEFGRIGYKYTSELKNVVILGHRPLRELTFLKRGFIPSGFGYLASLEWDSIFSRLFFRDKRASPEDFRQSVRSAIIELSPKGQERWKEFANLILWYSRLRLNWVPDVLTYEASLEAFLGIDDAWF